jgi:hypothetical protein
MHLYIDKENLESFISNSKDQLFNECTRTMQRQLDITFNFSKEELKKDENLLKWFSTLTEGVYDTKKEFSLTKFPVRPLTKTTYHSFDSNQLSAVYLISDEYINELKKSGAIIIGMIGEEIEIFKQLFLRHNDYIFDRELRIGSTEFSNWEHLEPFTTPLTEIIVVDPFILKNTENEITTIDENLIKWLNVICTKARSKVNIIIVYSPSNLSYNIEDIKRKIIRKLFVTLEGRKPNITFIKTYKEHDRSIITNYLRITGNTFNYWNERGQKITKGKEITIKSLARKDYHENMLSLINDVQSIIDNNNNDGIEGDKISNFLYFK